jgi:hypothetical protein
MRSKEEIAIAWLIVILIGTVVSFMFPATIIIVLVIWALWTIWDEKSGRRGRIP